MCTAGLNLISQILFFVKERASEKNESLTHLTGKVNYKAQNNHKKSAIIKSKKKFYTIFRETKREAKNQV